MTELLSNLNSLFTNSQNAVNNLSNVLTNIETKINNISSFNNEITILCVLDKDTDVKTFNHEWFKQLKHRLKYTIPYDETTFIFKIAHQSRKYKCVVNHMKKKINCHFKSKVSSIELIKYNDLNDICNQVSNKLLSFHYTILSNTTKTDILGLIADTNNASQLSTFNKKGMNLIENAGVIRNALPFYEKNNMMYQILNLINMYTTFTNITTNSTMPLNGKLVGASILFANQI
jgi:hypothetical protein